MVQQAWSKSNHDDVWVTFYCGCVVSLGLVSATKTSEKQRHPNSFLCHLSENVVILSMSVACCFKTGFDNDACSHAHTTTLSIHCPRAIHVAQLVCDIDHLFHGTSPFWCVCKVLSSCNSVKAVKMSRHLYSLAGKECNAGVEVMGSTPGGTKILVIRELLQNGGDSQHRRAQGGGRAS